MKKLMMIFMIVFAFIVSCSADEPTEEPITEVEEQKNSFLASVKDKTAVDYTFTDESVAITGSMGTLNFKFSEPVSETKALYTGMMGSITVWMAFEVKDGDLYATEIADGMVGRGDGSKEKVLAATPALIGELK